MAEPFPLRDADLAFIIGKLRASGKVWTTQRDAFYNYFNGLTTPADGESLWLQIRAKGVSMSRETVYNTLKLLLDLGFADRNFNPSLNAYEYWPVRNTNS
ncbi:ferric uptake regulator family protein [Mucilaginibacter yixingensis]|uniref:Ferric uptake regulator family protein n=1 Tax=Mucilaginibacter yixingensis TaxID=1295612 RepID=A0A2T5JH00_9SPHI|nr:transcriptional repressor [Mucilaginibacter yixingensis]PTR01681.1 ferric uptake regulator family protein [Mucilaginibacter yixingensis]